LIAYLDHASNFKIYQYGEVRTLMKVAQVQFKATDYLLGFSLFDTLYVYDNDEVRKLSTNCKEYLVKDSIIIWQTKFEGTLQVYYRGEITTIAEGLPNIKFKRYMAGDNLFAFVNGAKPLLNVGIGYQWLIQKDLLMMAGFRTDFNYRKNFNYNPYAENKQIKGMDLDMYHISAGLSWRILGQDLITGFQYTIGAEKDQQQFANLSDPVEFNTEDFTALTGPKEYTMDTFFHSISIYFGATFNFGNN